MQENLQEAERRIEEARRTRAESLDLGDLALSVLPASLGHLPDLRVLRLGSVGLDMGGLAFSFKMGIDAARESSWAVKEKSPELADLSPLAGLQGLQTLDLQGCGKVRDLSPLASLPALQDLDLSSCGGMSDLSPLASLSALQDLNLTCCQGVADLSPLAGLRGLQSLDLRSCPGVTDLSPLASLPALQDLILLNCQGVTDLSPLAGHPTLQRLDLSSCQGVTDLAPLAALPALQDLDLASCEGVTDLSPLAGHRALQSLDLHSCPGVTDLAPLAGLPALERLNLKDCQGVTDVAPLAGLRALQSLDLQNCTGVTDLPPLSGLEALQSLDLQRTGVTDLAPLNGLEALQRLDLQSCRGVTDLSSLAGLRALQRLDLGFCFGVTDLSPLAGLRALQHLVLKYCRGVTDLSPLAGLRTLQGLDVNGTGVTDLAPLSGLQALQWLNLGGMDVTDLAPLAGLQALQGLGLIVCRALTDLAPLVGLQALQNLTLWSCPGVTDLAPLAGLQALQRLVLKNCQGVTDLAPLAGLHALQRLVLWGCRPVVPVDLLRRLASLPALTELVADELIGVPREILCQSRHDNCLHRLRSHLAQLDLGTVAECEVKVILLGNRGVGKTQLCRRLRGEPFDVAVPATQGVQIWREELRLPADGEERALQVSWWDFGGQDLDHGTHALFLRGRAVFVILWTPALENHDEHEEDGIPLRNQPLAYWLDDVRSRADPDSPVIMVQSRCDRYADRRPAPPIPAELGFVQCCFSSARTDVGRATLEGQLRDAIGALLEQSGAGEIGRGQDEVRRRLFSWRSEDQQRAPEQRQHRTLPLDRFRALCDEAGGIASWEHALEAFHHSGVVLYEPHLLADCIVLDPDWVLDAIATVFRRKRAAPLAKRPIEERKLFLELMESCGVCFPRGVMDRRYVVPDLLPGFEAVADRVYRTWKDGAETSVLRLEYRSLHSGLVRGLMRKIGQKAEGPRDIRRKAEKLTEYWKYGLWFHDSEHDTQLLARFEDTRAAGAGALELQAQGSDPLGLLRSLRGDVRAWKGEKPARELLTFQGATVDWSEIDHVIDGWVLDTRKVKVEAAPFAAFFEGRDHPAATPPARGTGAETSAAT